MIYLQSLFSNNMSPLHERGFCLQAKQGKTHAKRDDCMDAGEVIEDAVTELAQVINDRIGRACPASNVSALGTFLTRYGRQFLSSNSSLTSCQKQSVNAVLATYPLFNQNYLIFTRWPQTVESNCYWGSPCFFIALLIFSLYPFVLTNVR